MKKIVKILIKDIIFLAQILIMAGVGLLIMNILNMLPLWLLVLLVGASMVLIVYVES